MPTACYPERDALRALCPEVFALVIDNATPKQWEDWLRAPIEHAAAKGNIDLVTALLKAGGTGAPGLRGCRGRTLLDAAAEGGNERVVSAILKAGAKPDLNVRSGSKRRSALHRAALHGHEAAARVLMMAGADVGLLDADKRGPLALAVRGGHESLVCSLLLGGANPSAKDKKGDAPLHLAAWRGRAGIASALLLKGGDKNSLDSQGRSPLIVAAEHAARGTIDALLMAGADTELRYGENELSSLDSAASHGHIGVLKALVQHDGVDVNSVDSTGYTALHMAADNNQSKSVGVLVSAGADVESQDIHQWTPLHCAARYNSCCDVVLELLRRGAKIDARESAGEYPLHIATHYLADNIVDLLLRWGADETKANGDGYIPAEIVGTYTPDEELTEEQRGEREERIRRLLVGAPADRAWRRRGWVVLCRNRVLLSEAAQNATGMNAHRQGQQTGHEGGDKASNRDGNLGKNHAAKVPRTTPGEAGPNTIAAVAASNGREELRGVGDGDGAVIPSTTASLGTSDGLESGRLEFQCKFSGACSRLMELTEEGVFREVVGFL